MTAVLYDVVYPKLIIRSLKKVFVRLALYMPVPKYTVDIVKSTFCDITKGRDNGQHLRRLFSIATFFFIFLHRKIFFLDGVFGYFLPLRE